MPPILPEVTSRQLEEALSTHEYEEEEETHAHCCDWATLHIPEIATTVILIALLYNLLLAPIVSPDVDNSEQTVFLVVVLLLCVFNIRKQIFAVYCLLAVSVNPFTLAGLRERLSSSSLQSKHRIFRE